MKKVNIKKIIFIVSLLPYAIILNLMFYYAVFGYGLDDYGLNAATNFYGFEAIAKYLSNVFFTHFWGLHDLFGIFAFILVLPIYGYQIYYLMSLNFNKGAKTISIIKKIIFIISILCWVAYFAKGIYAFFYGVNFIAGVEYGIEALKTVLLLNLLIFCTIPVLPISLMYAIIYLINEKKNKRLQKQVEQV